MNWSCLCKQSLDIYSPRCHRAPSTHHWPPLGDMQYSFIMRNMGHLVNLASISYTTSCCCKYSPEQRMHFAIVSVSLIKNYRGQLFYGVTGLRPMDREGKLETAERLLVVTKTLHVISLVLSAQIAQTEITRRIVCTGINCNNFMYEGSRWEWFYLTVIPMWNFPSWLWLRGGGASSCTRLLHLDQWGNTSAFFSGRVIPSSYSTPLITHTHTVNDRRNYSRTTTESAGGRSAVRAQGQKPFTGKS